MSTVDRAGPDSEISMCSYHMTGRACSVLPTGILVSGQETLAIWTLQPGYRDESGMNFSQQDGIVFLCLLAIFHVKNIPFHPSDSTIRVAKGMIGAKVIILCFDMFALFLELRAELVPRIFGLSSSRKPGWNFSEKVPVTGPARLTELMWGGL